MPISLAKAIDFWTPDRAADSTRCGGSSVMDHGSTRLLGVEPERSLEPRCGDTKCLADPYCWYLGGRGRLIGFVPGQAQSIAGFRNRRDGVPKHLIQFTFLHCESSFFFIASPVLYGNGNHMRYFTIADDPGLSRITAMDIIPEIGARGDRRWRTQG